VSGEARKGPYMRSRREARERKDAEFAAVIMLAMGLASLAQG